MARSSKLKPGREHTLKSTLTDDGTVASEPVAQDVSDAWAVVYESGTHGRMDTKAEALLVYAIAKRIAYERSLAIRAFHEHQLGGPRVGKCVLIRATGQAAISGNQVRTFDGDTIVTTKLSVAPDAYGVYDMTVELKADGAMTAALDRARKAEAIEGAIFEAILNQSPETKAEQITTTEAQRRIDLVDDEPVADLVDAAIEGDHLTVTIKPKGR